MIIKKSVYVSSSTTLTDCPSTSLPEYAFVGRSNVGKSSIINMLTGRTKLARTSSSPGKTRVINHFLINEEWYLVDLPGYGYTKTSKSERDKLVDILEQYILYRKNLTCLFLLLDSRLKPQENDKLFINWLGRNKISFVIVFTKTDKVSKNKLEENERIYLEELQKSWSTLPKIFFTSSLKKIGRKSILDFIEETNASLKNL